MTALSTHFISNEGTVRRVYIANIAPWNVLRSTIVCTDFIAALAREISTICRNEFFVHEEIKMYIKYIQNASLFLSLPFPFLFQILILTNDVNDTV